MSTENLLEGRLILDEMNSEQDLMEEIDSMEKGNLYLVYIIATIKSWPLLSSAVCSLRSRNMSSLLLLTRMDESLDKDQKLTMLTMLRDWDQLILHNLMAVCSEFIPKEYDEKFRLESKTEMKWFREWLLALSDPRLHKYPNLPWRSFIRKIVSENFNFARNILLESSDAGSEDSHVQKFFSHFLDEKKKVVCLFPKRWSKTQA